MSDETGGPTPRPDLPPDAIEGYRILRVLGEGGMATVYAAQQDHPRRTVAVKVLRPSAATPQMLRRFRKEVDLLAKLSHPCIAQVYAAGVVRDGGSELPYFVMEFVPSGRPITEFADAHGLDRRARLKLFAQVCAAIEHGHRQRVLHLDIKPANVLITREGHVKVIDFGVARVLEQPAPDVTAETADGAILGSLHAMSPEQVDPAGHDLSARSDVYSLGVLLYRLLLGRRPYEMSTTSIVASARTICETPPTRPRDVDAGISPELEAVMLRAMEKEPSLRYRSAGEFGKALVSVGGSDGMLKGAKGDENAAPKGNARVASHALGWLFAVAIGVTIIASLVIFFVLPERDGEPDAAPKGENAEAEAASASRRTPTFQPDRTKPFYLVAHAGFVSGLAMNDAGDRLASVAHDRTVRVWNLASQSLEHTLTNHEASLIECVALHPDGAYVASGSSIGVIMIEETEHGRIEERIALPTGPVHFVAYSAQGQLAAASDDLTVRIWDANLTPQRTLRSASGALVAGCFDEDATQFAAASTGGQVYVWNLSTGRQDARYDAGDVVIRDMTFGDGGDALTIVTDAGVVVQFEHATGERLERFAVSGESPVALALHPAGTHVFVARADRSVEAWSIADGTPIGEPIRIINPATRMVYDSASGRLAIGSADGAIEVHHVPLAAAP